MSQRKLSFNPYQVLGVEQSASAGEIQKIFLKRLTEDPGSSMRYQHAYRILKNADLRKQLNTDLEEQIWDAFEPGPTTVTEAPKKKARRSFFSFSRSKLLVLGVLLTGLAVTGYFSFAHDGGIMCPDCHHTSIYAAAPDATTLRCTREVCAFTYVYDETQEEEERKT